jgi:hypothetical protein
MQVTWVTSLPVHLRYASTARLKASEATSETPQRGLEIRRLLARVRED